MNTPTPTLRAATAKMKLSDYLDGMLAATSAKDLEAAIQAPFKHNFRGPTWSRICAVRIKAGMTIVDRHPLGDFVPHFSSRRILTVCGESCRVGRGHNSTGTSYVWHAAKTWAVGVLRKNGLTQRAAYRVWEGWSEYPHRCLATVEAAKAGDFPDPVLDTLVYYEHKFGNPIKYSAEQNDADQYDRRASRPCRCGGTLFDWGASNSEGFDFISWHCNACADVATEYLSPGRLYEIRRNARMVPDIPAEGQS
jgi:hypothetical protein